MYVILLENEHKERNDELLKLENEERKVALKEYFIKAKITKVETRMLEAKAEEFCIS
ncbi:1996_t:CDS:2 [Funneliformis mosseae]|uniref:1996_t:CDS:1 n=1 Tax=Funneliformis mosseae TaxID=27381 RepID=A0A9N9BV32_FUNMO|nr:1996_t:CDS:2 [Funneliformis mosseae]